MNINRKISINKKFELLEAQIAELEGACRFLFDALERSNVIVADLMLKTQGSSLEEFTAAQQEPDPENVQKEEIDA